MAARRKPSEDLDIESVETESFRSESFTTGSFGIQSVETESVGAESVGTESDESIFTLDTLEDDDPIKRCHNWECGSVKELKELADIILTKYQNKDMEGVEMMCKALLHHEDLPAFYQIQMHSYLSCCPGFDPFSYIAVAKSWLGKAWSRCASLGWIPEELHKWNKSIEEQESTVANLVEGVTKNKESHHSHSDLSCTICLHSAPPGTRLYFLPGDKSAPKMCRICLGRQFRACARYNLYGEGTVDAWKYEVPWENEDPPGYCFFCRNQFGGYDASYRRPLEAHSGRYACCLCYVEED